MKSQGDEGQATEMKALERMPKTAKADSEAPKAKQKRKKNRVQPAPKKAAS